MLFSSSEKIKKDRTQMISFCEHFDKPKSKFAPVKIGVCAGRTRMIFNYLAEDSVNIDLKRVQSDCLKFCQALRTFKDTMERRKPPFLCKDDIFFSRGGGGGRLDFYSR